jgi:PAS domain S-box-containing protein
MLPSVITLAEEERTRLDAVVEMSLQLAGTWDIEVLLQNIGHIAREVIPAQYAWVSILDQTTQARSVFFSGVNATALRTVSGPPAIFARMLVEDKALRLRGVTSESVGFDLPLGESHLASVLGVPLGDSSHVRGWLLLANRLGASGFNDQDEELAVNLAHQATCACERMEGQRRAHEELRESRDVLEAMFESAPDAIAAVDGHGSIVRVNAQTLKFFGYSRDELIGQPVEILVPERFRAAHPERREEYSSRPRRRPMGEGLELFGRRKDASEFSVDIMLSPLQTKRGKLMLSVIRDATARKHNEVRIQQLNRSLEKHVEELQTANQELEGFSYSVSHDLRAPLRQVDGFARILRERMGPEFDPDTSHYLQRIQDAATHMGCLLEGLLDLARLGRQGLRVRPTDLNLLASQVVEELKLDVPGRQIEWIVDPLPVTLCDAVLVRAVLSNLLSNAVKFTSLRECAIIRLGHQFENGEIVIFVSDNGVGFNMKYADKLFGIFQRLHRSADFPGTGIGLATVQRIIKKHGGRIWAEAELNSCATFFFTLLPKATEQADQSKDESEELHGR